MKILAQNPSIHVFSKLSTISTLQLNRLNIVIYYFVNYSALKYSFADENERKGSNDGTTTSNKGISG